MFAELAILHMLRADGWDGVWVDTYRGAMRVGWPDQIRVLPPMPEAIYQRVVKCNGGRRSGCWDVFAWRGSEIRFVEAKRLKKDDIRKSQRGWLEAGLAAELSLSSFLFVEWDSGI
jgi:hypothetical protein